ncbi:MAG: iron-sulfur cluster assembly scaffold protein, partial [Steroidobacteraceae bacterium]
EQDVDTAAAAVARELSRLRAIAPGPPGQSATRAASSGDGLWLCGEAGSEQHGTRVQFALRMQGQRVLEAHYRAYGCPHTLAACEWLASELQGRELAAPLPCGLTQAVGGPLDWVRRLAIPAAKLGRLLVIEDALRAAVGPKVPVLTRR